jgi:hypothetical protein
VAEKVQDGPEHQRAVDQLLDRRSAEIRDVAERVRDLVRGALLDASERVNPGWGCLAYHDPRAGYVCGIFPRPDAVRLLFEHGASLDDPDGIFSGGGAQTRYLDLLPGQAIPARAIWEMIDRAVLYRSVR